MVGLPCERSVALSDRISARDAVMESEEARSQAQLVAQGSVAQSVDARAAAVAAEERAATAEVKLSLNARLERRKLRSN